MKNIKLAWKLTIGFGLVLILTGVVAVVGYNGITSMARNAALADAANLFVKNILESRRNEKNFVIRGATVLAGDSQNAVEKMDALMVDFKAQLADTRDKFRDTADVETIDTVTADLATYELAFQEYVSLEDQKTEADATMVKAANDVLAIVADMQASQKEKLGTKVTANNAILKDRTANAIDTNQLVKSLLETNGYQKDFILRQEQKSVDGLNREVKESTALLETLKPRLPDPASKSEVDKVVAGLQSYQDAFKNYVTAAAAENQAGMDEAEAQMAQAFDQVLQVAEGMQAYRNSRLLTDMETNEIYLNDQLTNTNEANQLVRLMQEARQSERDFMLHKDPKYGDMVNETIDNMVSMMKEMKVKFTDSTDTTLAEAIVANLQDYQTAFNNYAAAVAEQTKQESTLVATARNVQGEADSLLMEQQAKMVSAQTTALSLSLLVAAIALVLGVGGAIGISRTITRPIAELQRISEEVAGGNVAVAININQRDEIGALANAFRELVAYFQTMAAAAEKMAQGDLSVSVTPKSEQDVLGHAFVRMIDNLRQLIGTVADNAASLGAASAQLSATAGQASSAASQVASTIQQVASGTAQQVQAVTRSVDIVEQVNRAIEAARAGEHGKGFAVVADEVRKLAEKSAGATKEIAGLIKGIQQTVNEAVQAMNDGTREVEEGVSRANEAGQALNNIVDAAEVVNRQVKSITAAAVEMNAATDELVNAMETVSAIVEENTASTEEMAAGSGEVGLAIESIASVSEENSAATEEVSAATEEMNAQVEEVTASAQSLSEMARNLQQVVAQFKLNGAAPANDPSPSSSHSEIGRYTPSPEPYRVSNGHGTKMAGRG
jgi:methyl-accepting chemotaxis protein